MTEKVFDDFILQPFCPKCFDSTKTGHKRSRCNERTHVVVVDNKTSLRFQRVSKTSHVVVVVASNVEMTLKKSSGEIKTEKEAPRRQKYEQSECVCVCERERERERERELEPVSANREIENVRFLPSSLLTREREREGGKGRFETSK